MGHINEKALANLLANASQQSIKGSSKGSKDKSVSNAVNGKATSIVSDVESVFKDSVSVATASFPSSVAKIFDMSCDSVITKSNDIVHYTINFYPGGETTRPSLYPAKYPAGTNIVEIFDKGIHSSAKKPVYGVWHGKSIPGLLSRPALGFINTAINSAYATANARNLGVREITYNYNN